MRKRKVWIAFGVVGLLAAAMLAIFFGVVRREAEHEHAELKNDEMAAVFGAQKGTKADIAGRRGEPRTDKEEGDRSERGGFDDITGPADERYARLAYPRGFVPPVASQQARKTFATYGENKQYTGSTNINNPFKWDLIGPTHATQPGILSFSGAQFHMAGRVTAMAMTPTCTQSRCRLYVGAAGGGVWRTDNPFSPDPYWVFLSQSFNTNAIGTLQLDPSDPSGNTIYAGTGEPNASGDSEAGVGIYKSTDGGTTWTFLTGSKLFESRAVSSIAVDPRSNGQRIYVGITRAVRGISSVEGGELSRSGPCDPELICQTGQNQAPTGLWESNDGGQTFVRIWDTPLTNRGVSEVELDPSDPSTIYASAFQKGLWRCAAIDGCDSSVALPSNGDLGFKQVFTPASKIFNFNRTSFDLTTVKTDTPGNATPGTRIYVGDGAQGPTFIADPDPNKPPVQIGFPSQVWRADGADTLTAAALLASEGDPTTRPPSPNTGAGWARKSSLTSRPASNPYRPAYNYCTGQCSYDNTVYTPQGNPNVVYVLGSYNYSELHERSNARGVIMSMTAGDPDPSAKGGNFTDLTWDDTPGAQPDQTHPDEHTIITPAGQPFLYFEGSDGGVIRSDGTFDDASADCARYHVNDPDTLVHCQRVLSRVPHQLYDTQNKGLSTLQFQSLSINPDRPKEDVQGGTQDNGTFDWDGQPTTWMEEIYGDGGQSGYNYCDTKIRFNTFFAYYTDENFVGGQPDKWVVTSGPLSEANNGETQAFYIPEVTDYTNCGPKANFPRYTTPAAVAANANHAEGTPSAGQQLGTIGLQYAGLQHVWRTIDNGGPEAYLEASCPEFTTSGDDPRCGDWKPLGDPSGKGGPDSPGDLTGAQYGDRAGGWVAAVERNPGNDNQLWAATMFGRVFVSNNVNDPLPGDVQFCRLDSVAVSTDGGAVPPPRFISSIYPDPKQDNRAWISYDGYNSSTPDAPGHVFEVTYTGGSATTCPTAAVWRDLHVEVNPQEQNAQPGDIPITDLVRDDFTGDLYAATDFGVLRGVTTDGGATYAWTQSGKNLPFVEVPGITIDPCSRLLYAATHGRSAWRMYLPNVSAAQNLKPCPRTP